MYHVHFGLEKRVFDDGIAQDSAVYLGARQQNIVADCSVALSSSDSVVVLTGRPGTGKTTLAGTAVRTTSTRLALGALNGGAIGTVDLLEWLLTEFGFARERGTRAERLQTWRQFLNEASTTGSRVFIVVERAEDLGVEGLRSLAALTVADLNGCPGANLLLLGDEDLHDLLGARELEALRQRIRLRQTVEPLTEDELALYVGHHVSQAGGEPMQLFPPETLAVLYAYSDGIPRLVNNLAETAASVAAAKRATHVAPAVVEEVARKFLGLRPPHEAAPPTAPAEPAAPRDTPAVAAVVTPPSKTPSAVGAPPAIPLTATVSPAIVMPAAAAAAASVAVAPPLAAPAAKAAPAVPVAPALPAAPAARATTVAPTPAARVPAVAAAPAEPTPFEAAVNAAIDAAEQAAAADTTIAGDDAVASEAAPAVGADNANDVPVLTDAVELSASVDSDTGVAGGNDTKVTAGDGYDDVEALPDTGAAMAETLFGDSDLDMLGAALAAGSWEDVESSADPLADLGRPPFAAVSSDDDDDLTAFAPVAHSP